MLIPTSLIFWLSVWQFKARAHEQLKDVVCHPAGLVGGGCETWSTVAVSGPCGERARPCPVYVVSGFRPDRHCGRCVNISAIRGSLHARIVGGAEGDAKTETYALEREAWNRLWGPGVSGDTCLGEHFRATVESAECVAAFECMVHEERDTCTNCEATTGCGARAEDPCVTSVQGEHCYGVKLSDSRELFLRTVDDPGRGRGPVRVGLSLYRRLLRPRAVPDACPSHAAPEWLPYTTYRCPSLHFEGEPRSLPPASVPSPHRSLAGESIHAIEVLSLTDIHPLWDHRFNSIIGAPDWSYANGHKYPTPHSGGPTADRSHIRWWTGDQFSFVYINYDLRPKVFTGYLNDDWTATERFNDFLSNVTEFKAVAGDATYSFSITIDERGFLIVYGNMNEFPFYMDTNHAHLPPEFKTANCLAWASINAGNPDTMHFIGDRTRVCPSTGGYKWVRFEHDRFGALYTLYRSIAGPLNHGDGTGERALSLARWRHDHVWHSFGAEHSPDGSVCVAAATADPPSESDFAGWDADVTWSHQGHMFLAMLMFGAPGRGTDYTAVTWARFDGKDWTALNKSVVNSPLT
eukprot:Polyplicarium_translucidae@DN5246_c0_g1_i1.p1